MKFPLPPSLLSILLALPAWAGETGQQAQPLNQPLMPRTYVYDCPDGYTFSARFNDPPHQVQLLLPAGEMILPRVPSASGARYSNGDITFWGKGEVAMLEENGLEHRDCPGQQAEAHWQ